MRPLLISLLAFALPSIASAEVLTVTVTDAAGGPVANAMVLVDTGDTAPLPDQYAWENEMAQEDLQFSPFVLAVPVGSEVGFPNRDRVRHHVYSFSRGNRFELTLYGRDETRAITFENTGVVAVGCNIHDGMIGYIRIVDTPHVARTDETGMAVLDGLPASAGEVTVWHPNADDGDVNLSWDGVTSDLSATLDVPHAGHRSAHH